MPYKISTDTPLLTNLGEEKSPKEIIEAETVVERLNIAEAPRTKIKIAEIKTQAQPAVQGWVLEKVVYPLYGQTDKADGLVLAGNQETKDFCQRFSKELDKLDLPNKQPDALQYFMIGALQCEDLDGKKVFYMSLSGSRNLPQGWEDAVKNLQCVPSPVLPQGQDHLRNLSGDLFTPVRAGTRVQAAFKETFDTPSRVAEAKNQSWDHPYDPNTKEELKPVRRSEAAPGACAAQKMLQQAIKDTATVRFMWEQWYDSNHGLKHNVAIESCGTCKVTVTRMLKRTTCLS